MNLGAMIDLGIDPDFLREELSKLKLEGWKLESRRDHRHGIYGTRVDVLQTREEHVHRHLSDVESIIMNSGLGSDVKALAMDIFHRIAEAEAKVHGIDINKVHFHEVGAVDSLIDIVGAAICYIKLGIDSVCYSPVELGGGTVKCAHGIMPVPAPATAEIVKGLKVKSGNVNFEATTPTGAAIIARLSNGNESCDGFVIESTGYGIGHKENPSLPNILRVYLGEVRELSGKQDSLLIEANIDDMNPEMWDHIIKNLFSGGADDVFLTNIIMKNSRPGIKLSVLCPAGISEKIKAIIFSETTTIGIREFPFQKQTLERKFDKLLTPYGPVTIKKSYHRGVLVSEKPEISECISIAEKNSVPLKNILSEIMFLLSEEKNRKL